MRILVADDQGFWRQLLGECLEEEGYDVVCADSGDAALAILDRDPSIALLITDWVMPDVTGLDVCRRVRARHAGRYLPVMLLTSRSQPSDLVEALDAGADAFLKKPFESPELLAQVRVLERILALEGRLESQIHDLTAAKSRIDRDLEDAARVQRALMPATSPTVPGLRFAWHYEPCAQLGGDIFNVIRLSENHLGIYVLDVSGHGTTAALHAVSLSHVLHPNPQQGGLLKHTGPNGDGWCVTPPSQVAAELNRRFQLLDRSGRYFTLLYGILELDTHRFRYVRAGHPGAVLTTGGTARSCDEGGSVPIGVTPDAEFVDVEIQLARGDGLLFLTDGVSETRNESEEEFGLKRVLEVARNTATQSVGHAVEALRLGLEDFRKLAPSRDDVTIVGLRID